MPTQRFGLIGLDLFHASLAQSVEHAAVNRRVVGSSPTWGAKGAACRHGLAAASCFLEKTNRKPEWAFSSVGQSSRLITGRSTVRAREGPPYRGIAQQVEQRSPKPRAEGSIPSAPATA